jgi:hypothetical protein
MENSLKKMKKMEEDLKQKMEENLQKNGRWSKKKKKNGRRPQQIKM